MAVKELKRRDLGALVSLIALELGLLCLLGATCSGGGAERAPGAVGALTFHWPTFGPDAPPDPVVPRPAPEPPPLPEVRRTPPKHIAQPPIVLRDVPEEQREEEPVPPPQRPPAAPIQHKDVSQLPDPCGGDLCCVAGTSPRRRPEDALMPWGSSSSQTVADDADVSGRVIIKWPASRRDDVVYRVFTIPGRNYLGTFVDNGFMHLRKPDDPDCYKIQACDHAGGAAGSPLTICITYRRAWGMVQ